MIKKFTNDFVQFDNTNELINYILNVYINLNMNDVEYIQLFINVCKQINDTHNANDILHIILYDDCFDVYEKNNIVYSYFIDDDYDIIYDDNEKYDSYNDYLQLNDLQYAYDDVLCMYINETKIFDCKCDNALCIVNDIQFDILYDCVYEMNDKKYEMIIKHNNNYYVVHDDFNECECINNYATKIKLTRIQ